jgi:hypothetical protein
VHDDAFATIHESATTELFGTLQGPWTPLHRRSTVGADGPVTLTLIVSVAEPPGPSHFSVYVYVAGPASGPAFSEPPDEDLFPVQEPDAVQTVAFVGAQESATVELFGTLQGPEAPLHFRLTVGKTAAPTFTATVSSAVPPGPVQERVYVWFAMRTPVVSEPDVEREPGAIQGPAFVMHDTAPVVVQDNVDEALNEILHKLAAPLQRRSTVGTGGAETFTVTRSVALPPGPVQVRVYV